MPKLAELVRAKYPGTYDDLSDEDLEKSVLAKHPEYADLAKVETPIAKAANEEIKSAPPEEPKPTQLEVLKAGVNKPDVENRRDSSIIGVDRLKMLNAASKTNHPNLYGALGSLAADIIEGLSAPENIAMAGAGLMKSGIGKVADLVKGVTSEEAPKVAESAVPTAASKPRFRVNTDGTYTNLETGETNPINFKTSNEPVSAVKQAINAEIENAAKLRGTPEDIPNNPKALALENERRNVPGTPVFNPKTLRGLTGTIQDEASATANKSPVISAAAEPSPSKFQFQNKSLPVEPEEVPAAIAKINQVGKLTKPDARPNLYQQVSGGLRELLTTYDFSAPGRQGKGLITHPEFWTSLDDMFKAWGSKEASEAVQQSIANHPSGYFMRVGDKPSLADRAGLALSDKLSHKEELFRTNYVSKYLPGAERSDRAYSAYLNKLRSDVFAKLVDQARAEGRDPTKDILLAKEIANAINISSGSGSLGGIEKSESAMKALNEIFFAPKLASSRVQMYSRVLDPRTYYKADPIVRKEALRSLLGVAGTNAVVAGLAQAAGATVNNDPTNSDFRKIKIGNTRIDNMAGLQQYGVAADRLLTGTLTSSNTGKKFDLTSGKFGMPTRASVATQFITNKLAPIPSFVWAWMQGKEFDGTPFDVKQGLMNRTVPLVMQDLYDLSKDDPNLLPRGIKLLLAPAPIFGEGMQTYGR